MWTYFWVWTIFVRYSIVRTNFVFQFLVSNILRNYLKTKPQNCFSLIEFGFRCPRICQGFVFIFLLPVWGFETLATTFFSVGYRDISRCAVSRPHFELEPWHRFHLSIGSNDNQYNYRLSKWCFSQENGTLTAKRRVSIENMWNSVSEVFTKMDWTYKIYFASSYRHTLASLSFAGWLCVVNEVNTKCSVG